MVSQKIAGVLLIISISFVGSMCAWISFTGTSGMQMPIYCSSNSHDASLCALIDKGLAHRRIFLALLPQRILDLFPIGVALSLFFLSQRVQEHVREQLMRNTSLRFYLWHVLKFSIFNPLPYAFSQGIIHPELYEPVGFGYLVKINEIKHYL